MESKPLSYDSLKCVLQYLDANKRFLLSTHCPSIKTTEKSVPLKMDHLSFRCYQIKVNEVFYDLTVREEYPNNEIPYYMKENTRGINWDLDEYGNRDLNSRFTISLPGDISFPPYLDIVEEEVLTHDQLLAKLSRLESHLEAHQLRLSQLNALGPIDEIYQRDGLDNDRNLFGIFIGTGNLHFHPSFFKQPRAQCSRYYAMQFLEKSIKAERRQVRVLRNQRDGITPNFWIQLTISPEERIEHVKYTVKLPVALKSLSSYLLGGHKGPIYVKRLKIFPESIARTPVGLKLRVRELEVPYKRINVIYEALKPILDESSLPLDLLSITYRQEYDLSHEIIRSAKILEISSDDMVPLLQEYQGLTNLKVHTITRDCYLSNDGFLDLVENWVEIGRDIGTCYTFTIQKEKKASDIVEFIREGWQGAVAGDRCTVIRMDSLSELKVCYETVEDGCFLLKFVVEPLGTTPPPEIPSRSASPSPVDANCFLCCLNFNYIRF